MDYEDKTIKCKVCKEDFIWTKGEQKFYASKELSAPTKCKKCRNSKKTVETVPVEETKNNSGCSMTMEEIEAIIKTWDENAAALKAKRDKRKRR